MSVGPSTTTESYLIGSQPNVHFTSILTAGDTPAGADDGPFVGIPDGIGAYDNGDGTITVLVNHELSPDTGVVRDHGSTGAFIDRIVIDQDTLAVVSSGDLIQSVMLWNDGTDSYAAGTTTFNRFCSSDLAEGTAFFNASSGLGSQVHIYLTGEEAGNEGRAFATIADGASAGTAFELPFLGNLSYENIVANPYAQDKTVVALTDDATGGQIYIYVGEKQSTGSEIEQAGLSGGNLYGIKVDGFLNESSATAAEGTFSLELIANASNLTGAAIETASDNQGVTGFLRPEDLAWDPDNPSIAYFVTTNAFDEPTRLYKLTFANVANPAAGGTIEEVINGADYGAHMFDNISVENGKVIIQEDPGNNPYIARVWEYDIDSGGFTQVANFDPAKFSGPTPITLDEESSGVIDVTDLLGDHDTRAYLVDAQVHAPSGDPATVQKGQLSVMYIDEAPVAGTNGDDSIEGNGSAQTFRPGNGDDSVIAWGGGDVVYGGNGNDRVQAGTGADRVDGERGNDVLDGGFGDDLLIGGQGSDRLIGGGDRDRLTGGQGDDLFVFDNRGETGDDVITDFGKGDQILTRVALDDPNGDGTIDTSGGLSLFGSSDLTIQKTSGAAVTALDAEGSVTIEGTHYYVYDLVG